MRLIEFAKLIQPERGDGPLDRDVNGVAWDCRRVAPGNLFVAIPSVGRDTQTQIETAVERGAAAVLCEGHEVVGRRATRLQLASVRAARLKPEASRTVRPSNAATAVPVRTSTPSDARLLAAAPDNRSGIEGRMRAPASRSTTLISPRGIAR